MSKTITKQEKKTFILVNLEEKVKNYLKDNHEIVDESIKADQVFYTQLLGFEYLPFCSVCRNNRPTSDLYLLERKFEKELKKDWEERWNQLYCRDCLENETIAPGFLYDSGIIPPHECGYRVYIRRDNPTHASIEISDLMDNNACFDELSIVDVDFLINYLQNARIHLQYIVNLPFPSAEDFKASIESEDEE